MLVNRPKFISNNTAYPFNMTKNAAKPFDTTVSMKFVASSVNEMKESILKSKTKQKGGEFSLGLGKMIFN